MTEPTFTRNSPRSTSKPTKFLKHSAWLLGGYTLLYTFLFSPVIFGGRFLAFSDTVLQYLPSFMLGVRLWDPLVLSGFPTGADPQSMYWYPLVWFFSWLRAWNGFVISTYVLSSCFMHGYVYSLTNSRLASVVGGISYGMSAFMTAHLGHTTLIHAAPWIVLWFWSVERLAAGGNRLWFLSGTLAISLCLFSGHPQMFIYLLMIGSIYVVVRGWKKGVRFLLFCAAIVVAGLCLTAIQVLPFSELAGMSHRARIGFQEYVSYSLPPRQLICLFFPFLFGGADPKFFPMYSGESIFVELACYLGFLPVLLGIAGHLRWPDRTIAWLWFGIAIFSLLQMMGAATPLAWLFYHLPIFNKLRAPARNTLILSMSFSVLAGLGVAAIEEHLASRKLLLRVLLCSVVVMILVTTAITIYSDYFPALSANVPFALANHPLAKPAAILPWLLFGLSALSLFVWTRNAGSRARKAFLLTVLILDLGIFGWLVEWRPHSVSKRFIDPPPIAKTFSTLLRQQQARMIPVRGGSDERNELPPNLSRLWNVPSAGGYGPLMLWRYGKFLNIYTSGVLDPGWSSSKDRALDLLGIRYVFVPGTVVTTTYNPRTGPIAWGVTDLSLTLGTRYIKNPKETDALELLQAVNATSIGFVTNLAWSGNVYDNQEVLEAQLVDTSGQTRSIIIRAGQDTSEWAYDCSPEGFYHARAPVFESVPLVKKNCEGHQYFSIKKIGSRLPIREVRFQILSEAVVNIHKVSLYDESQNTSFPFSVEGTELTDEKRWRHVNQVGNVAVFENLRTMPRAWLVPRVIQAKADEVLKAIRTSKFSDGKNFNPVKAALVEEPIDFQGKADSRSTVKIEKYSNRIVELSTHSRFDSFLVLSEIFYPGWKAKIDGREARVYRTNFIMRGVEVPRGQHRVRFEYNPTTFYLGASISVLALVVMAVVFLALLSNVLKQRNRKLSQNA